MQFIIAIILLFYFIMRAFIFTVFCLPDDHLLWRGCLRGPRLLPGDQIMSDKIFTPFSSQESNYESMIDKSVRNTVELQYNSSNVAVLQTFDLLQEGVGDVIYYFIF